MKKLLILLLALTAIAIIGYFCIYKMHGPAIQSDIASRTQQAMTNNGLSAVGVNVDGRDITLSGVAANQDIIDKAVETAKVDGYNVINNEMTLASSGAAATNTSEPDNTAQNAAEEETQPNAETPQSNTEAPKPDDSADKTEKPATEAQAAVETDAKPSDQPDQENANQLVPDENDAAKAPDTNAQSADATQAESDNTSEPEKEGTDDEALNKQPPSDNTDKNASTDTTSSNTSSESDAAKESAKASQEEADAKAAAAKAKTLEQAKQCQQQFNTALSKRINFASASATIQKSSYSVLNKLAAVASQCSNFIIEVHGHTDATGNDAINKQISYERANAVVQYLVGKNINSERLAPVGHGSSKPIASNKTAKGRARNRRIEISVEVNE